MALLLAGASPAVFTDYPMHNHDCYEIILNLEGEGMAEIGGREYPFSPGTIHVIPPRTPHRKRSEQGFRDIYLHTDTLGEVPALPREEPLLLADDGCRTMESLFSVILGRTLLGQRQDAITETLFGVVLRLVEEWSHSAPADPVISGVIHTIAASYSDPEFQVTGALEAAGYSKDYLRRRFVRATGTTPNAYLRTLRINHAKQLLRQRERLHLSVGEIALQCGFYDSSYFCRCFQKETGVPPTAYASTV